MNDPFLNSYLVPGWCWPREIRAIYEIIKEAKAKVHIEVGTFCGKSLFPTAKGMEPNGTIYSVDPLKAIDDVFVPDWEWVVDVNRASLQAIQRLRPDIILKPIRDYNQNVAKSIKEEIDTVYIDGNHELEFIEADLKTWIPKIRPGGIIFGHDFSSEWPTIERAIQELDRPFEVIPQTRIWKIQL